MTLQTYLQKFQRGTRKPRLFAERTVEFRSTRSVQEKNVEWLNFFSLFKKNLKNQNKEQKKKVEELEERVF